MCHLLLSKAENNEDLVGKPREKNKEAEGKAKDKRAKSYRSNSADEDRRWNKAAAVIYPIQDSGVG